MENLFFNLNLNYVQFSNAGVFIIDNNLYQGIDTEKISLDFGIFYNFSNSLN